MYSTVLQVFSAHIFQLNEAKQLYLNQPLTQATKITQIAIETNANHHFSHRSIWHGETL